MNVVEHYIHKSQRGNRVEGYQAITLDRDQAVELGVAAGVYVACCADKKVRVFTAQPTPALATLPLPRLCFGYYFYAGNTGVI